jgi:hypothetical protein
MGRAAIAIEPVVSYPRTARPGERHYLTVDIQHRHPPDAWPYDQEELALTCLIHTPLFTHEPLGDQGIVLHRFGGSYGPAAFLLTAKEQLQKGAITLSFVNRYGMTVHTVVLEEIEITARPPAVEPAIIDVPLWQQQGGEVEQELLVEPSFLEEALETSGDWVSFSGEVSEKGRQRMTSVLSEFRQYLVKTGVVEGPIPTVSVHLYASGEVNASYDANKQEIRLFNGAIDVMRDLLLREYAHHVLCTTSEMAMGLLAAVEFGLACYLVCSFKNSPGFGAGVLRFGKLPGPFLWNLDNRLSFREAPDSSPEDLGEIWGGAFWELRQFFGAGVFDQLLVQAWRATRDNFQRALLQRMARRSFEKFEKTSEVLLARGAVDEKEQRELLVEAVQPLELSLPPFTIDRPEVEQLFKLVTDPHGPAIIRLEGYYGQGSATVLRHVGLLLERQGAPVEFFLFDVPSRLPKGFDAKEFLGLLAFRLEEVIGAVERRSPERRVVVGIGNFHRLHVLGSAHVRQSSQAPLSFGPEYLLNRIARPQVRLLVACRPDTPELPGARVFRIQDMDAEQVRQLSRLYGVSLSDEGVQEFLHWTGGSLHLAEIALQGARQHRWSLEDLMRFEGEEWSRIFDAEIARVRQWVEQPPGAFSMEALKFLVEGDALPLNRDAALQIIGQGFIREVGEGRYAMRTPLYKRVFHPQAVARLPRQLRDRIGPHQWYLFWQWFSVPLRVGDRMGGRLRRQGIRLILDSHDAKRDPLPGPVRFRLTPEIEKTVEPEAGRAVADFFVPIALGPTTAYAELDAGRYRLSVHINSPTPASDGPLPPPSRKPGKKKPKAKPPPRKRPDVKK